MMQALEILRYHSPIYPVVGALAVALAAALSGPAAAAGDRFAFLAIFPRRLAIGIGVAALLILSIVVSTYLLVPSYIDHVEPQVASVSSLVCRGLPAHHAVDSLARYSFPYGPLTYQLTCLAYLALGQSIVTSKLIGVLSFFGCLAALAGMIYGRARDAALTIVLTAAAAMTMASIAAESAFDAYFWNRPDPLAMFLVALGAWASFARHWRVALLALGVLAGATANCKIHSAVILASLLPFAVAPLTIRRCIAGAMIFGATAAAGLASGFVVGDDILNYVAVLKNTARHPFWRYTMLVNALFSVLVSIPVIVTAIAQGSRLTAAHRLGLVFYLAAAALVSWLGSKLGAGPQHLLPMIPVAIAVTLHLRRQEAFEPVPLLRLGTPRGAWFFAVWLALLVVPATANVATLLRVYKINFGLDTAEAEMREIARRFPTAKLGVAPSGGPTYFLTWVRPILTFASGELMLDAGAEMDFLFAGLPMSEATIAAVADCRNQVWVFPRDGRLFELASVYDRGPVYSEALRSAFQSQYRRTMTIGHYDIWQCRAGSPSARSGTSPPEGG